MKLKLAERDRLLALAEEAERAADAEAAKVTEIEAELEELLEKVASTQQALAEVRGEGLGQTRVCSAFCCVCGPMIV